MGFRHPLDLPRYILDPLHGPVRLTEAEISVLNSRVFGRLRRIKQNGLLYLIFPSATHSRFEHSLGVLHLADEMLRSLFYNSVAARGKDRPRVANLEEAKVGEAINFGEVLEHPSETRFLFQLTRFAALVHDLGHGPLSHAFEKGFAPTSGQVTELIKNGAFPGVGEIVLRHEDEVRESPRDPVDHEVISCLLFDFIWRNLSDADRPAVEWQERIPASVGASILNSSDLWRDVEGLDRKYTQWLPLIGDLVASAPADADRMDYLERDSVNMGVTYGLHDRSRVLKSLVCYRSGAGSNGHYRLGFKKSGLRAVENFIQARFQLFAQVYHHKTNRAILSALKRIAKEARCRDLQLIDTGNTEEFVDAYVELDDHHFIRNLRGEAGDELTDIRPINSVAEQLFRRRLWKRVRDCESQDQAECLRQELEEEFDDRRFVVDKVKPKAIKGLEDGAALLTKSGKEAIYSVSENDWTDSKISSIIATLAEEEERIVRVYLVREKLEEDLGSLAEEVRAYSTKIVEAGEC